MTLATLTSQLATVVGIPIVPYGATGEIDHDRAAELIHRLVAQGLTAITPNGNTGEFYALSPAERRAILATVSTAAREAAADPGYTAATAPVVIAGVGLDLDSAIGDARFARDTGADAIMIHQPVLPYLSPDGWVDYNVAIARAVPELGVVPYLSTTAVTGVEIARLMELAPNVIAIKYSVPDPVVFATTRAQVEAAGQGHLLWIAGLAESYAPSYWQAGARAFTSGLVNVVPAKSLALLDALRAGDAAEAEALWRSIRAFEHLRTRNRSADNVSVVKEAMDQLGLCDRSVRPPSAPLDAATREAVRESIADWAAVPVNA